MLGRVHLPEVLVVACAVFLCSACPDDVAPQISEGRYLLKWVKKNEEGVQSTVSVSGSIVAEYEKLYCSRFIDADVTGLEPGVPANRLCRKVWDSEPFNPYDFFYKETITGQGAIGGETVDCSQGSEHYFVLDTDGDYLGGGWESSQCKPTHVSVEATPQMRDSYRVVNNTHVERTITETVISHITRVHTLIFIKDV